MAIVKIKHMEMNTCGEAPKVAPQSPSFSVTGADWGLISLEDFKGVPLVINAFPSLDTKVCHQCVAALEKHAGTHDDIGFINISMDLPFALKRI